MKGHGFKVVLTVFFLVLSGYYLYPTVQNYFTQRRLRAMDETARAEYERTNFEKIQRAQERSLNLGLDLQGGMHVTLEVRMDALIRELATDRDEAFEQVLQTARDNARTADESVVDAFVDEFERRDPNARLSRYFRNAEAGISRRSTNAEVAQYLRTQGDEAIDRAIKIIRDRVDRYGVTEPSIQKQGAHRVVVELPGIDDEERVRRLLRGTARLEFRLMAEPQELQRSLQQIVEHFQRGGTAPADTARTAAADTTAHPADSTRLAAGDTAATAGADSFDVGSLLAQDQAASADSANANALLSVMQPVGQGVVFGMVAAPDTAKVRQLLSAPAVQEMLPNNVRLLYGSSAVGQNEQGQEVFQLLGVRSEVDLTGEVITEATVDFDELNQPQVTMVMNGEGARTWARLTGANVGKNIAIVLDNVVYSYPNVLGRIPGGRSSITGLESREEAQDIVTILLSGALPAPVEIAAERTVGPSLGAASIRDGAYTMLFSFLGVCLFMLWYYKTAGIVANVALLFNVIFIFGIMAAFRATLTLPGIAGIVLTMGMAVDANVLIYERIREELATGKTLKAAIDAGFTKAFSAIFDGNITTFFTGVILYSFGVGPIQGFAVTLMAGIISSMFTAIVIARVIFDYMVVDRHMKVSFE